MGKFLDIDDVVAGHPVAEKELADLRERIAELERERDDLLEEEAGLSDQVVALYRFLKSMSDRMSEDEKVELHRLSEWSPTKALARRDKLVEASVYDDIAAGYAMTGDDLYDEYKEMANELRREAEGGEEK